MNLSSTLKYLGYILQEHLEWHGSEPPFGAGAGLLKRRGLALFVFHFFKVYHFYI